MDHIRKVDEFLNRTGVCYFSTEEHGRPHVRPIGFHLLRGDKIYFVISNNKDVYRQLIQNPHVEIVASEEQNWMRYAGRAVFEEDDSVIASMLSSVPELQEKFGGDNKEKLAILHLENAVCEFRRMTVLTDRFELNGTAEPEPDDVVRHWNMTQPDSLRELLEKGHFEVWFQPQYDLKMRAICGAEALVRFRDDSGTIITPNRFIPAMEASGVIELLDFYVFEHICRHVCKRMEEKRQEVIVSSNFSRRTMSGDGFVERLIEIVDRYGINHRRVAVEITETAEAESRKLFLQTVRRIHDNGFRIAIDDFGVLGANMRLLTETDFNLLKIDKSVIDSVHLHKETCILISALIHACHQLGSKVLAEGVETEEQVQALLDVKCDAVQGYHFGRPMPEKAFENLLSREAIFSPERAE